MKKLLPLFLSLAMALTLAACTEKAPMPPDSSSSTVLEQEQSNSLESSTENDKKNPTDSSTPEITAPTPAGELSNEQFDEIWTELFGYWNAAEGRFAVFDAMDSNTAVFSDGIWDTGYGRDGTVSEAASEHEYELTLTVFYHATEATEAEDAQSEKAETILVDYSGLEQDGKIRIKIGDNDWRQYMFAGNTQEEAYQTYMDNTYPK